MFARSLPSRLLPAAATAAVLAASIAGCGDDASAPIAVEPVRTAAQDTPPAAVAPGVLGAIADVPAAHRRLAYVNPEALAGLGGPLPADEIAGLTLGSAGASRLQRASEPAPRAVVQVGPATVFAGATDRTVSGADPALRDQLTDPAPAVSLITAETPSAIQSCLGDPAAAVIIGPSVVGRMSSVGASVITTEDAPAGPKLLICGAPHYARDLHRMEDRLKATFPAGDAAAGTEPVIAEQEIGEREIVGAAIAMDQVDPTLLRELLAGGPALVKLIEG